MSKNSFWMIIGCTLPLLLVFLLPISGITGKYTLLIFFVLLFGGHLIMMERHGQQPHSNESPDKNDKNESHQH